MFHKLINFHKKSIAFSWLASYLLILLVPILISIIIFIQSDRTLQNEISDAKLRMLQQVQELMDIRLRDARNLTVQIALNSDIQSIMYAEEPLETIQRFTIQRIIQTLATYKQSNPFIDDFYIYIKKTGKCLTPTTHIDGQFLFEAKHGKSAEMSYENWLDIVENTSRSRYIPISQQLYEETPQRTIGYIQPIPLESPGYYSATAVILMNEVRFNEVLKSVQWKHQGDVFILDENNTIMASNRAFEKSDFLLYNDLSQPSGIFYDKIDGRKVVVCYVSSKMTKWKYVSVTPVNIFMENATFIRSFIIFGIVLCFFIGGTVIYLLLKKNYNVVNELVQSISTKFGLSPSNYHNEYGFIQEVLSTAIKKQDLTNEELARQNLLLKSHFMYKLLKGRISENIDINDSLTTYNIEFYSEDFAVMLININYSSPFYPEDDKTKEEDRVKLIHFIFTNVIEELSNEANLGIMVEMDDMLACLVNFKNGQVNHRKETLFGIADKAINFINDNFQISSTIAISNIHQGLLSIPVSYHESLDAMEYQIIIGNSKIIHYEDIKNTNHHYNYSYETEHQLTNFIKAGDFVNSKILLDQIFQENFYQKPLSIQMAKCLFFDLVSTILKTIDQIGNILDKTFIDTLNPTDLLLNCQTVKEMRDQMEFILQQVCFYINKQREGEDNQLSLDVINFIENHYDDINMNISMLGYHFNLTPSYLSKLFKEQANENLADCINRIRLEKAKDHLHAKSYTIQEIALKTGYTSSAVFIRTFKKFEGITPGQYKDLKTKK